jgi:DNA-binding response OmpR family regulator
MRFSRTASCQPGMNFIQKPFAPDTLAAKIREVLDAR